MEMYSFTVLSLCLIVVSCSVDAVDIAKDMEENQIVPDVIDVAPQKLIEVSATTDCSV